MKRQATAIRKTKETAIEAFVCLEGSGKGRIETPIHFFNHMINNFCCHGLFDLNLKGSGDLEVDQHHLLEDCGLVLGEVFKKALGTKKGINRCGYFVFPMDEALAVAAVDLGGRPFLQYDVCFKRRFCGDMDSDLLQDFFQAFAVQLQANLVIRLPFGRNDHHKMEAAFKALGKAMRMACSMDPRAVEWMPSTKGVL